MIIDRLSEDQKFRVASSVAKAGWLMFCLVVALFLAVLLLRWLLTK